MGSSRRYLFRNARLTDGRVDRVADLRLAAGLIAEVGTDLAARRSETVVDAAGFRILPGLINAHDHLDLNLLPLLGNPPYRSFYDWAEEIYRPEQPPISDLQQVPIRLRYLWSAYRCLLGGVTTVAHHGDLPRRRIGMPVRVVRRFAWSHSLGFADDLTADRRRGRGAPWFVHAAEGIDRRAADEIPRLEELGLLGPGTVLVHAVAAQDQIDLLARRQVGVVWCPSSNLRLYGQTAPVRDLVDAGVSVALGSDSTLSGELSMLEEIRVARATGELDDAELLSSLTEEPARLCGIGDRGQIAAGLQADLVLIPDSEATVVATLSRLPHVSAVFVGGRPRLLDRSVLERMPGRRPNATVSGSRLWLEGDPGRLIERTRGANRSLAAGSPLVQRWTQGPPPIR